MLFFWIRGNNDTEDLCPVTSICTWIASATNTCNQKAVVMLFGWVFLTFDSVSQQVTFQVIRLEKRVEKSRTHPHPYNPKYIVNYEIQEQITYNTVKPS